MDKVLSKEETDAIERKFKVIEKYHTSRNGELKYDSDKITCATAFKAMDEFANQEKRIEAIAFCQDVLNEIEINGVRLIDYKKVDAEKLYEIYSAK